MTNEKIDFNPDDNELKLDPEHDRLYEQGEISSYHGARASRPFGELVISHSVQTTPREERVPAVKKPRPKATRRLSNRAQMNNDNIMSRHIHEPHPDKP